MNKNTDAQYIIDTLDDAKEDLRSYAYSTWQKSDRSSDRSIQSAADLQKDLNNLISDLASVSDALKELSESSYEPTSDQLKLDAPPPLASQLTSHPGHSGPHSLEEDFRHKKPLAIEFLGSERVHLDSWRKVYAWFLTQLAELDIQAFQTLPRTEFSVGKRGQVRVTSSPFKFTETLEIGGLYFEGNHSANTVAGLMISLLAHFGLDIGDVVIYLQDAPAA